jgi:serine phosphatase RsbU (regulator of sigma subunit)
MAIGRQGAQALERARLYEERAYVARTLQEGLLPRALPQVEGLELDVRYRPIGDGSEVGGDFYDVVPLNDGSWLATVGDICGKGTGAAVLTGVMRSTIRALALNETRLAAIVAGVNEALIRESSPMALASLGCATLRRDAGGVDVCVAAGGHPPALILRRGGAVEVVAASGPMLGVQRDAPMTLCVDRLDPGDLLLLYTDGVIDARRAGREPFGEGRLHAALAAGAGRDASGVLDVIDAAVRAYAPGAPRDDKALLAVRARG